MAVAHMTCYQHFISKTSMANAVRSKWGPGALCVGPRRSLFRAPALSLLGPNALCRGPAISASGPGALSWRPSAPALFVGVCGGARRSSLHALCVGPQRFLCRGSALSVSGFCVLCVGARRCSVGVCVGARRSLRSLFRGPALSL